MNHSISWSWFSGEGWSFPGKPAAPATRAELCSAAASRIARRFALPTLCPSPPDHREESELVLYQTEDGITRLHVRLEARVYQFLAATVQLGPPCCGEILG
jgi:hypothetical protein